MFKKTAKKPGSINLMRGMGKGLSDQFLNWSFTVLRAILMIVYAVALVSFLYRFGLDREIIDLKDKIEQQQVIVSLTEKNEKTYRDLQARLEQAKQTTTETETDIKLLDSIISDATGKILFSTLEITSETMQMEGSARSIESLNLFVDDLKKKPQVKTVTLDRLESRVDQGVIVFRLTATL